MPVLKKYQECYKIKQRFLDYKIPWEKFLEWYETKSKELCLSKIFKTMSLNNLLRREMRIR